MNCESKYHNFLFGKLFWKFLLQNDGPVSSFGTNFAAQCHTGPSMAIRLAFRYLSFRDWPYTGQAISLESKNSWVLKAISLESKNSRVPSGHMQRYDNVQTLDTKEEDEDIYTIASYDVTTGHTAVLLVLSGGSVCVTWKTARRQID